MSKIVGIDLGTTNSLVAEGHRLTPSVVHIPAAEAEPIVGHKANRVRVLKPAEAVYSAKRFMGRRGAALHAKKMLVTCDEGTDRSASTFACAPCSQSGCFGSFGPVQTTRECFTGLGPLAGMMESHASSPSRISPRARLAIGEVHHELANTFSEPHCFSAGMKTKANTKTPPVTLGTFIVADPLICHGKPTIKGTRIMVWQILDELGHGMSPAQIVKAWGGKVSRPAIAECVGLARRLLLTEEGRLRHPNDCRYAA